MLQSYQKLLAFFPEIENWDSSKTLQCLKELFNDTTLTIAEIEDYHNSRKALNYLLHLPKVEQRSSEWFKLRESRLTASDLAQAIGKGKFGTRQDLLVRKAFPDLKPFETAPPLKWGTMFEDMGMRCYQERNGNVHIHEFGLIPNEEIECFGASPDGITEDGVMVEMKCPYKRKFDGAIPEQYYLQIQGQLATCKLTRCDYVECYMNVFENITEYELCVQPDESHGIILEFMKGNDYIYEYSPEKLTPKECIDWAHQRFDEMKNHNELRFEKMTPWKLRHIFIKRVIFDPNVWNECIPQIYQFWKEAMELREKGVDAYLASVLEAKEAKDTKTLYMNVDYKKEKPKYKFIMDSDEES